MCIILYFSRNISVQLVWEGLNVAGDIVAIQWIPRATGSNWYATYVTLYTKTTRKCFFQYLMHIQACNQDLYKGGFYAIF